MKSSTLNTKITTDIQYSQFPLYGRVFSRIETIPVPMLAENHLLTGQYTSQDSGNRRTNAGVKFRTTLRQPHSSLDLEQLDGWLAQS